MRKHWQKRSWAKDEESLEEFEGFSKIRKREKKSGKTTDLQDRFEVAEDQWVGRFPAGFAARVVEVHKRYAFVSAEPVEGEVKTNDIWLATIARKFLTSKREGRNFVCVGDRVFCVPAEERVGDTPTDLPQCVIQMLSPRKTVLARIDPSMPDRSHILASNLDQVMIVASYLNPKVRWGLIDRYLTIAELESITPIIVLNKQDLLDESDDKEFSALCKEMVGIYRTIGYKVFSLHANARGAAKNSEVIALRQTLVGKITGFSGHSGVGKSSIINLFKPELVQSVEPDADIFYKGRHTTTYASFIKLGSGGYVIDTPGIRSFPIASIDPITLTHCFIEMRPFVGKCKFRECRHVDEPGCEILVAVASGVVSRWRYRSYLGQLLNETGREGRTQEEDFYLDHHEDDEQGHDIFAALKLDESE